MEKSNKPELVLRDGSLKATIWRNNSENGHYYSTDFAKTYSDQDGKPRDTRSFSRNELLRVAELSREAFGAINELRREKSHSQGHEQSAKDNDADRAAFKQNRRSKNSQDKQHGLHK